MSAVLRVSGTDFDVDAFLPDCALLVCAVQRRGEPHGRRGPSEVSAVTIDVSTAEFGDLAGQVADALHFLDTYANQLARLASFPGLEDLTLDFALVRRDVAVQCDRLPAELVRLCGRYGIGVELSYYPAEDEVDPPSAR